MVTWQKIKQWKKIFTHAAYYIFDAWAPSKRQMITEFPNSLLKLLLKKVSCFIIKLFTYKIYLEIKHLTSLGWVFITNLIATLRIYKSWTNRFIVILVSDVYLFPPLKLKLNCKSVLPSNCGKMLTTGESVFIVYEGSLQYCCKNLVGLKLF